MSNTQGAVTIIYQPGATFTANGASIQAGNGGAFQLQSTSYLSFQGTFAFSQLEISSGVISFANVSAGTAVSGTVVIPVTVPSGTTPTITASNFAGVVNISWPGGPPSQELTPGTAFYLDNFGG
jgi:hypothetical protein